MRCSAVVATVVVAATAIVLTSCAGTDGPGQQPGSGASDPAGAPASSATSADPADPVGVIALGDSGMTGYQSDPDAPGTDAVANSWATGTNPEVDSITRRLSAVVPETADHVVNVADNGVGADALASQADSALRVVPTPRLALVQIGDNDIRCDGTDPQHLPEFRSTVRQVVQQVVAASPKVTVVLMGGAGEPARYAKSIASLTTTPVDLIGDGPCDFFSANRVVNTKEVAHFTSLVNAYKAELAKACAGIPQCHTDGGAAGRVTDTLKDFGVDLQHPSATGHAHLAAAVWPEVASALGLS